MEVRSVAHLLVHDPGRTVDRVVRHLEICFHPVLDLQKSLLGSVDEVTVDFQLELRACLVMYASTWQLLTPSFGGSDPVARQQVAY